MAGDGQSLLFAESWACRISRYWFDGPDKGKVQVVIPDRQAIPTTSTAPRTVISGSPSWA